MRTRRNLTNLIITELDLKGEPAQFDPRHLLPRAYAEGPTRTEPVTHVQPGAVHLENEGSLHFVARGGGIALRWVIGATLIATILVMVSPMWFLAPLPPLVLLVSYMLFVLSRAVQKRSDAHSEWMLARHDVAGEADVMEDASQMDQLPPRTRRIVRREVAHGMAILATAIVIAVLVAALFLPWRVATIGAFVAAAYIILVTIPVWLGWIEDDIEVQEDIPRTPNQEESI